MVKQLCCPISVSQAIHHSSFLKGNPANIDAVVKISIWRMAVWRTCACVWPGKVAVRVPVYACSLYFTFAWRPCQSFNETKGNRWNHPWSPALSACLSLSVSYSTLPSPLPSSGMMLLTVIKLFFSVSGESFCTTVVTGLCNNVNNNINVGTTFFMILHFFSLKVGLFLGWNLLKIYMIVQKYLFILLLKLN